MPGPFPPEQPRRVTLQADGTYTYDDDGSTVAGLRRG